MNKHKNKEMKIKWIRRIKKDEINEIICKDENIILMFLYFQYENNEVNITNGIEDESNVVLLNIKLLKQ